MFEKRAWDEAKAIVALERKVLAASQSRWRLSFLSCYFYGTEMMHCKTQTLLSDFVAANSDRFKKYSDGQWCLYMNHVQEMHHLSVWGTQVELRAIASLFQVTVYMLTFSWQQNKYMHVTLHCHQHACINLDSPKLEVPSNRTTPNPPFWPWPRWTASRMSMPLRCHQARGRRIFTLPLHGSRRPPPRFFGWGRRRVSHTFVSSVLRRSRSVVNEVHHPVLLTYRFCDPTS